MNLLHSVLLGIVQGLTEFLPISSSAHLAFLENFFKIEGKLQVTVFMHFGSMLALIVVMWKDIKEIILKEHKIIWLLVIGSIPAGILGIGIKDIIESAFNSIYWVGVALVVTGIILWLTFRIKEKNKEITLFNAFLIGIAQGIAIVPGISRSGSTIATGIYLGHNRTKVAKFSLLLGIISICGATLIEAKDLFKGHIEILLAPVITGVIISFITSYFAIKLLLRVVKTNKFAYFAFYCWIVGFLAIIFSLIQGTGVASR